MPIEPSHLTRITTRSTVSVSSFSGSLKPCLTFKTRPGYQSVLLGVVLHRVAKRRVIGAVDQNGAADVGGTTPGETVSVGRVVRVIDGLDHNERSDR